MALTTPRHDTTDVDIVSVPTGDGQIRIPDAGLFGAEYARSGPDLLITVQGGPTFYVSNYFASQVPADLIAPNGAILRGNLVVHLAGPEAPGLYAQNGNLPEALPIGQVESLEGDAAVVRTDGVREALTSQSKIFAGDLIETGADGRVSVTFVDGTIFTLATQARMVIDELIYDPGGSSNSATFSLIQGGFVFIAGQVAPSGGIDISTPAATMGIRGTTGLINLILENGLVTLEVSLVRDPDGSLGRIDCFDLNGNLIAEIGRTDVKWVISPDRGLAESVERTDLDTVADSVLLTQAVAAFLIASNRVEAGGTFVQLQSIGDAAPETGFEAGTPSEVEANDLDEPTDTAPQTAPEAPPEAPTAPVAPPEIQDQGSLEPPEDPLTAPSVTVTVLEDAEEGVEGTIAVDRPATVFAVASSPSNGSVELSPEGNFVYTPNADFNGQDSFEYEVREEGGPAQTGTVVVEVAPVNDAPDLPDASLETSEDVALSGSVAGSDVDGDTLSYEVVAQPSGGTVAIQTDGAFTYTPVLNFNGTDTFLVEARDGLGGVAQARVTVTVIDVNDAPEVTSGSAAATGALIEDSELLSASGELQANDPDAGATLTWQGGGDTTFGRFEITTDGAWTYRLDPDAAQALAAGQTVTETTIVTVSDERGGSAEQMLSVDLTGANDGPAIILFPATGTGAVVAGSPNPTTGGLVLASDPDSGAELTWGGGGATAFGSFEITEDGTWTYRLDPEAAQSIAAGQIVNETADVTVSDGLGGTSTQTLTVTVTGVNDAPVLDTTEISVFPGLTASGSLAATDPDGDPITFELAELPQNGQVVLTEDGSYSYQPDAGFTGLDSFKVAVTDDAGVGGISTVFVSVSGSVFPSAPDLPLDLSGVSALQPEPATPQITAILTESPPQEDIAALLDQAFGAEPEAPDTPASDPGGTTGPGSDQSADAMFAQTFLGGGALAGLPPGDDDPGATTPPSA